MSREDKILGKLRNISIPDSDPEDDGQEAPNLPRENILVDSFSKHVPVEETKLVFKELLEISAVKKIDEV